MGREFLNPHALALGLGIARNVPDSVVLAAAAVALLMPGLISDLGGLAAFVLLASLSSFFFPTRTRLDPEAVRVTNPLYWRRRAWSEFRGFSRSGPRLKLLSLPPGSRLDNYRGMLVLLLFLLLSPTSLPAAETGPVEAPAAAADDDKWRPARL